MGRISSQGNYPGWFRIDDPSLSGPQHCSSVSAGGFGGFPSVFGSSLTPLVCGSWPPSPVWPVGKAALLAVVLKLLIFTAVSCVLMAISSQAELSCLTDPSLPGVEVASVFLKFIYIILIIQDSFLMPSCGASEKQNDLEVHPGVVCDIQGGRASQTLLKEVVPFGRNLLYIMISPSLLLSGIKGWAS